MVVIKLLILAFLISISNEGSCAITTLSKKYTDCRDKKPTDETNNVCCYFKAKGSSGDIERCVELRRVDIDGKDKFKATQDSIKSGTYDYWLMGNYTGFEEYDGSLTISDIDSIRCNNSQFLKFLGLFAILFILY